MEWSAPIDSYCERLGIGLWAEPLNLVSNLAFLVAALAAWRLMRERRVADAAVHLLVAEVFAVGLGSGLFHSVATYWAMWADIVPIVTFLMTYLLYFLRFILGWSWWQVGAGLAAFIGVSALGFIVPADWVNGSNEYFGALVALAALRIGAGRRVAASRRRLTVATLLFAISVALRSVDLEACRAIPLGTHFIWHLCNAVVLYQVLALVIERLAPTATAAVVDAVADELGGMRPSL